MASTAESRRDVRPAKRPSERGLTWAALLTAAAAQALFWLPLGYREPEPEERAAGSGVGLLSRRAFGEDAAACRRFLLWMERHDPVNFLGSGARGGFSAQLPPPGPAATLPERRPQPVPPTSSATRPPAAVRTAAATPKHSPLPLLPSSAASAVRAVTPRAPGRPRLFRADGGEFDAAEMARWSLPDYTGSPGETLLAVGGAGSCRRMELMRSCGVAALDRLALVETTRRLADFADGEVLAVGWPERAPAETEKGNDAP